MINDTFMTLFEQLATETILEIFEYLSSNDILYTFFDLNQRFNSILLQHQQFWNTFQMPKRNFDFWQNNLPIIGSYIQHLIININSSWFSIDLFPNLQTLIISPLLPIHSDQIYFIMKSEQFKKIISFKIKTNLFNEIIDTALFTKIILENIFNTNNSLHTFEYSMTIPLYISKDIDNFQVNKNIHSLSLNLANFVTIFSVLEHTPNLKYLNLTVTSMGNLMEFYKILDLSNIKLEKFYFTHDRYQKYSSISEEHLMLLINFVKQFSLSLIDLSLNLSRINIYQTNTFQFNGILLEQQLLESMRKLKSFHLYVKFDDRADIKNILSTFKNQFWLDHKWFIGIHGKYIYTLPFHFNQLDEFIDFDNFHSNNLTLCNSPQTWFRIKSISVSTTWELNLNLINEIKRKMPNLISISFSSSDPRYPKLVDEYEINQTDRRTLNNITTIQCDVYFLEYLIPLLMFILPNAKHCILFYSQLSKINNNLNILYFKLSEAYTPNESITTDYTHFSGIEDVEIKCVISYEYDSYSEVLEMIKKVLETFKNSKNFLFHFHHDNNDYSDKLYTFVSNIVTSLNMNNYEIKQIYNYVQLIK